MESLKNKTALITGGGTGIGIGTASHFLEQGAKVYIAGLDEDDITQAIKKLSSKGDIDGWACDITDEDQVADTLGKITDLDILVANAGSGMPGGVLQMTEEHWSYVNTLNITGTALCIKHAGLAMKGRGGSIITMSSVAATRPSTWMAAYSATKAGVEMLTKVAAAELAPFNIRVNSIAPGIIDTEAVMTNLSENFRELTLKDTLLNRYGTALDIAQMATFLAGDNSTFITGQVFSVDGGLTVQVHDYEDLARSVYGDATIDDLISKNPAKAPKRAKEKKTLTGEKTANFDGVWETSVKSPVGEQRGVMTIKTERDRFTGTSAGAGTTMEIKDGQIDGNTLTWTLQLTKPVKMKIKGQASVNGDEMVGTIKLGMLGRSPLHGTRKK